MNHSPLINPNHQLLNHSFTTHSSHESMLAPQDKDLGFEVAVRGSGATRREHAKQRVMAADQLVTLGKSTSHSWFPVGFPE